MINKFKDKHRSVEFLDGYEDSVGGGNKPSVGQSFAMRDGTIFFSDCQMLKSEDSPSMILAPDEIFITTTSSGQYTSSFWPIENIHGCEVGSDEMADLLGSWKEYVRNMDQGGANDHVYFGDSMIVLMGGTQPLEIAPSVLCTKYLDIYNRMYDFSYTIDDFKPMADPKGTIYYVCPDLDYDAIIDRLR